MSLTTIDKISLDFYNVNIETVNAKQNDHQSRYIEITCTDHGKKVNLIPNVCSAYIRYKTNNGFVFEDTEILENGAVRVTLSSGMLSSTGRHNVDLMITTLIGVAAGEIVSLEDIYAQGATVISTMSFYLNVIGSTVSDEEITSTYSFSVLTNTMSKLQSLEYAVEINEADRQNSEKDRIDNERSRCENETQRNQNELERAYTESIRSANEELRSSYESDRCSAEIERDAAEIKRAEAEIKRQDNITGEAYRIANETAREQAESTRVSAMNEYIADWDTRLESIVDSTGIVMKEEKGVANGVATLNENGQIPYEQLNVVDNLTTTTTGSLLDAKQGSILSGEISKTNQAVTTLTEDVPKQIQALKTDLEAQIAALPVVHFLNAIDNNVGKNGDILMIPINE